MREWLKSVCNSISRNHRADSNHLRLLGVLLLACWTLTACSNPPRIGDVLEPITTLKLDTDDAILRLAVSPDGRWVVAMGYDNKTIYVWDVAKGKIVYRLAHRRAAESRFTFTPDASYFLSGDVFPRSERALRDKYGLSILDERGKARLRELTPAERFTGHLWDIRTGQKVRTYYYVRSEDDVCWSADTQFRPDGKQFAERGRTGLYLCDAATAKPLRYIPYPWLDARGVSRERDSGRPYLGTPERFVMLPDWKMALVTAPRFYISSKKDDRSQSELMLLWLDLHTGQIVREVAVTPKIVGSFHVWSLGLSADGRFVVPVTWHLASIKGDNTDHLTAHEREDFRKRQPLRIYDTRTGKLVTEISVGSARVGAVFSSDSHALFVGGDRVTAWDIRAGRKLGEFDDSRRYARSSNYMQSAVSADGCTFVAGGENGVIYVWAVKHCQHSTTSN